MNADLQEQDVDVAIIGAGVSGLVSAYHLQSKNAQLSTVVLEAKGNFENVVLNVFDTWLKFYG